MGADSSEEQCHHHFFERRITDKDVSFNQSLGTEKRKLEVRKLESWVATLQTLQKWTVFANTLCFLNKLLIDRRSRSLNLVFKVSAYLMAGCQWSTPFYCKVNLPVGKSIIEKI